MSFLKCSLYKMRQKQKKTIL